MKSELDLQILNLLGPKTADELDRKNTPKSKGKEPAPKSAEKSSSPSKPASNGVSANDAAEEGIFPRFAVWQLRFSS